MSVAAKERAGIQVKDKPVKKGFPVLRLTLGLNILLACFAFLPGARRVPQLQWSIVGAAVAMLLFLSWLAWRVRNTGRVLFFEYLPRPVHYVQLTMHSSIYAYWGWYWPQVYHEIPLIIAQLFFVYVLDMLVCWSRRDKWILGFGPFPIVLSTNLFLWFKPEWFFLQFLMLATGVLCKEFVTWIREGRRVHIFNPSAIALFIFSVGLIVTHSTHISWGEEIAVSFDRPPHIYLEIFLLGLVVQGLFSVTLVTLSAAASLYALNLLYTHSTGIYYFVDTNIPAAVFLGLHLLVTDPATSPRKNFGKIIFGTGYGVAVFGLYWLLGWIGAPTFYDKLLCVPPLNLTVRALDRLSDAFAARVRIPAWRPKMANYAHMAVWICLFAVMSATHFLGGHHPGADSEFWRNACFEHGGKACDSWVRQLNVSCTHGSGQACMILGSALDDGSMVPRDPAAAGKNFAHGCELGLSSGCARLNRIVHDSNGSVFQSACNQGDGESCFLLGSLVYAGIAIPKDPARSFVLFQRSCSLGFWRGCGGLAELYRAGQGTAADSNLAIQNFKKACREGIAPSCFSASSMSRGLNDTSQADAMLRRGCELTMGFAESRAAYLPVGVSTGGISTPPACSAIDR